MVDFNVSLPQTKVTWIKAHPKNCPVYFSGYRKTRLPCEWHLLEPVQIKRAWQKELNPPSVCQASPLATELTYSVVVAAASLIVIRATVSRLLSWTKDQWFSRKLPGLQQQIGTAEVPSLVEWANSGCWPPQWQALGDSSNHWGTSLRTKQLIGSQPLGSESAILMWSDLIDSYITHALGSVPLKNPHSPSECKCWAPAPAPARERTQERKLCYWVWVL